MLNSLNCPSENHRLYKRALTTAKVHLIRHDYKSSLSTCLYGLELLSANQPRGFDSEDTKDFGIKVAFGILAIQSLASNNQGTEVNCFVEKWFGPLTSVPAEILQIWTCVYIQKNDYQTTLNIIEKWFQNQNNHSQPGFGDVIELYMRYIVVPMQKSTKAMEFLNNFGTVISETSKQYLLTYIERPQQMIPFDQDCIANSSSPTKLNGSSFSLLLKVIKLCATTKEVLTSSVTLKKTLKTGIRLVIVFYFMYAIIARTDLPGDIFRKGSGPVFLWNAVKQAWMAMFAPYHLVP